MVVSGVDATAGNDGTIQDEEPSCWNCGEALVTDDQYCFACGAKQYADGKPAFGNPGPHAQGSVSILTITIGVFLGMLAFSIVYAVFWYLFIRALVDDLVF